jgi:hypothetical protein
MRPTWMSDAEYRRRVRARRDAAAAVADNTREMQEGNRMHTEHTTLLVGQPTVGPLADPRSGRPVTFVAGIGFAKVGDQLMTVTSLRAMKLYRRRDGADEEIPQLSRDEFGVQIFEHTVADGFYFLQVESIVPVSAEVAINTAGHER